MQLWKGSGKLCILRDRRLRYESVRQNGEQDGEDGQFTIRCGARDVASPMSAAIISVIVAFEVARLG